MSSQSPGTELPPPVGGAWARGPVYRAAGLDRLRGRLRAITHQRIAPSLGPADVRAEDIAHAFLMSAISIMSRMLDVAGLLTFLARRRCERINLGGRRAKRLRELHLFRPHRRNPLVDALCRALVSAPICSAA